LDPSAPEREDAQKLGEKAKVRRKKAFPRHKIEESYLTLERGGRGKEKISKLPKSKATTHTIGNQKRCKWFPARCSGYQGELAWSRRLNRGGGRLRCRDKWERKKRISRNEPRKDKPAGQKKRTTAGGIGRSEENLKLNLTEKKSGKVKEGTPIASEQKKNGQGRMMPSSFQKGERGFLWEGARGKKMPPREPKQKDRSRRGKRGGRKNGQLVRGWEPKETVGVHYG